MLEMFFTPKSVAVVGAARQPGKLGFGVLNNLVQSGYPGTIYPINPNADEILGLQVYPSVLDTPGPVDLVVIVVPNKFVAQVMEECGQKGVKGAIIITSGFKEVGKEGAKLEREVMEIAERYGIRVIGPNCLGTITTHTPINASFASGTPEKGNIAFMSQSGALGAAVLDWAAAEEVGFSHFASLGNKADVNEIDLLQAWDEDENTKVIVIYMEGIERGPEFMRVAREVTRHKPVVVIKSGNTAAGSRAVSSHTGSLAGSAAAYDAAFEQAGLLRAESVEQMFDFSLAFAYQPPLKGKNIVIVTNAGGPGIMATDAIEKMGLTIATLEESTTAYLKSSLPAAASVHNPVDVMGDALADRYALALEAVVADNNVDGVLVLLTPQVYTQIEETAEAISRVAEKSEKPIVACFIGEQRVAPGLKMLNRNRVPAYLFPERAVASLWAMAEYWAMRNRPEPEYVRFDVDQARVREVFDRVRSEGRLTLGDAESRDIMEAYGLRIPKSILAATADEAVTAANSIGYPVVMKIASPDILHKSDMGGVRVNVRDAQQVRDLFDLIIYRAKKYKADAEIWGVLIQEMVTGGKEVIIGVNKDPQFGPLMLFGLGGIYVEVMKDVTFRVAPVSRQEAEKMISEIRSYKLLQGVRGEPPSDLAAVVDTILRASQLVTDFPEIAEMDINPLAVRPEGMGAIAVDMRFVLQEDK